MFDDKNLFWQASRPFTGIFWPNFESFTQCVTYEKLLASFRRWFLRFLLRKSKQFWLLTQTQNTIERNPKNCKFEKLDFRRKIHQKHVFQIKFSPRLFRLHILDSDHVWSTVFFEAYSKIKIFVHEEPLHQPPQKCNNFRIFMIFYRIFENFMIFIGLDGGDPGVRKFWCSSMLTRKQYFTRGLNLKYVIWKVFEKTWFEKHVLGGFSFTNPDFVTKICWLLKLVESFRDRTEPQVQSRDNLFKPTCIHSQS